MPGSHQGERGSDLFGSPPQSRRKSIWKSEPRVLKLKGTVKKQHLNSSHHGNPPLSAITNGHHRSSSPYREKKKKESGASSFLDVLFPKRKSSSAAALHSSAGMNATPKKVKPTPTPEAIARGVEILKSIFPKWDTEPLQALLEINDFVMEETISAILKMEAVDESTNEAAKPTDDAAAANATPNFPIKNPIPDDFLRLPEDVEECAATDDEEEDEDDAEMSSADRKAKQGDRDGEDTSRGSLECKAESVVDDTFDENLSEKSSSLAEDDGTLYGKEFSLDDDDIKDEDAPPVFNSAANIANYKLVADSMNQKFIPVELRNQPSSIFDTSHIDVIKRSKLNLSEAENRIRHREPHLVFELLSKASEIYRHGVISSHELDLLRSMIVNRIQPTKMLMDMTMNMDGIISDHEWHLLILKAKGIRQGLSIRVINEDFRAVRSNTHMEYMIRVVDIESGVVWFTRKRFREFYKLHRKLSRLSGRVNACDFPTRRSGRNSANSLASDRAPILETFLRTTAALVTPSPLTFLHGVALKQLQQFLDVPHVGLLERNRTQPIPRELRVYVYHTVHDFTSPEGKACAKFLAKIKQNGVDPGKNLLEEIGDILDGVQEYMLEHRFDEMSTHIQRLMKYFGTADHSQQAGGRTSSFVSLTTADVLSNNDKLQQMISDAIRHELEERICVPLMLDLNTYLRAKVLHKEQQFRQRVFQLKGKPQSYFGIPIDKISLSSWRSVVETIKEIDDAFLPLDKMRKLVATAHNIHTLYKSERQMYRASLPPRHARRHSISFSAVQLSGSSRVSGSGSPNQDESAQRDPSCPDDEEAAVAAAREEQEDVLSGDDFLPIFIYVIVHSDLVAPIMTQVLLNRLCDPEKRRSESGYYLATFEAALHHILSRDIFDAEHE